MSLVKRSLCCVIYVASLLSLGLIIVLSASKPGDNLFAWQMTIGELLTALLIIGGMWFFNKTRLQDTLGGLDTPKIRRRYCLIYGMLLFLAGCVGRNDVYSFYDYGVVWDSAWELAGKGMLSNSDYFLRYSNNIKPMLFLSVLFKLSWRLGLEDPYYLIVFVSAAEVLLAVWSVSVLTEGMQKGYRFLIFVFFACCLPIWVNVQAFYTDSMSFTFSVLALALLKKVPKAQKRSWKVLLSFTAGVITAFGIAAKVTIFIPILAMLSVLFLTCGKTEIKKLWHYAVIVVIGFGTAFVWLEVWADSYEFVRLSKQTSDPAAAWIAMGLHGDGSYYDSMAFIDVVHSFGTKAEKSLYCKEYIKQNFSAFFDVGHIFSKIRRNYASGHLGNTDYAYLAEIENNVIYELFSPYGRFYWRTSQISFCYIHAMYIVCFIGNIISLVKCLKKEKIAKMLMIADLSMLGYFIFLLIWEANNRQLYNMVPILITAACLNGNQIVSCIEKIKKK